MQDSESRPENTEETEVAKGGLSGLNRLTESIIGAAIEVHRHTGPGLMESVYEECLCYELSQLGLRFQRQVELPVRYKGIKLKCGFRMDLVVQDSVVLELKIVDELLPVHSAQLLTYLKLSGKKLGLLINFNEPILKRGLKRLTTMSREPKTSSVTPVSSVFSGLDSLNPLCLCASVVNNLRCSQDTRNKAPSVTSVSSEFSGLDFDFSVLSVSVPLW